MAELEELPEIVEKAAQSQADVERNMMQTMAAAKEPEPEKEVVKEPEREPEQEIEAGHVGIIRLVDVSEERLDCLKTHSVIGGMKYEIVEVR
jgi:hypothetical protein